MNISEAKRIRIVDFLQTLGHLPIRIRHNQYWYLSPCREEQSPSFKVNDKLNEWYDFGLSEGGGIIELVLRLYRLCSVSEALRMIENQVNALPPVHTRMPPTEPDIEEDMKDMRVVPLTIMRSCLICSPDAWTRASPGSSARKSITSCVGDTISP